MNYKDQWRAFGRVFDKRMRSRLWKPLRQAMIAGSKDNVLSVLEDLGDSLKINVIE